MHSYWSIHCFVIHLAVFLPLMGKPILYCRLKIIFHYHSIDHSDRKIYGCLLLSYYLCIFVSKIKASFELRVMTTIQSYSQKSSPSNGSSILTRTRSYLRIVLAFNEIYGYDGYMEFCWAAAARCNGSVGYCDCIFITPAICSWPGLLMKPAAAAVLVIQLDCWADIRQPFSEPYGDIRFGLIVTFGLTRLDGDPLPICCADGADAVLRGGRPVF